MFARLASSLLRIAVGVHTVGAAIYWLLQPRGFEFGSLPYFEHQVIAPGLFAVGLAGAIGLCARRSMAWLAMGILGGFWVLVAGTIGTVGSTTFARGMIVVAGAAAAALGYLVWLRESRIPAAAGGAAGVVVGCAFLFCTWAPPATTHPSGGVARIEAAAGPAELRVRVSGRSVLVEGGKGTVRVQPAPEFFAASDRGIWTLFDFRTIRLPAWEVERRPDGALALSASTPDLESRAFVVVEGRRVRIRCATTLKRDIASHLSSAVEVDVPDRPMKWRSEPTEFFAFQGGRLRRLRASAQEKGPFAELASWEPHDPLIRSGAWQVQVVGWAEQASRAPSPTAGWGVSQGTIELVGGEVIWSLASTSIGRGWHSVRTAKGTYVLETVIDQVE